MADLDEEWLMAPCLAGAYTMAEMRSGKISLEDVAIANEALAVRYENERRIHEALEAKAKANR